MEFTCQYLCLNREKPYRNEAGFSYQKHHLRKQLLEWIKTHHPDMGGSADEVRRYTELLNQLRTARTNEELQRIVEQLSKQHEMKEYHSSADTTTVVDPSIEQEMVQKDFEELLCEMVKVHDHLRLNLSLYREDYFINLRNIHGLMSRLVTYHGTLALIPQSPLTMVDMMHALRKCISSLRHFNMPRTQDSELIYELRDTLLVIAYLTCGHDIELDTSDVKTARQTLGFDEGVFHTYRTHRKTGGVVTIPMTQLQSAA